MLDFQYIKNQYPSNLQKFERSILREYLQAKILQVIFESNFAYKLSFLGGTALRMIYQNNRFSEDIDLDNFDLTWEEFELLIQLIEQAMKLEGFEIESKSVAKDAYRCYLRFPTLLYEQGISPLSSEKILIQIDTTAQGYPYEPEILLLNKFDVFTQIRVTPLNILLSQKIFTSVNRKRPKGRDFYDITFLTSLTKPDMGFLYQKMEIDSIEHLRDEISKRIADIDFKILTDDVAPFLINQSDIKRIENFKQFWQQMELD
jgi:predicted nucleotidyltransferase component of viral defense system